jgi:predicted nucleotidyltransferase
VLTIAQRNIGASQKQIASFCRRWKIREFALFGSALREDFSPQSDVDILVSFAPGAEWSLLDHVRMEQELEALLGRPVDLFSRQAVERSHNWIRRREILDTAEVVYAAQR